MKLFEILAIWCIWFILTDDMADCRGLPNRSSDFGNVTLREVKRAKREGALSIDLPSSSLTGGYRNQDQDPDFSCKDRFETRPLPSKKSQRLLGWGRHFVFGVRADGLLASYRPKSRFFTGLHCGLSIKE